MNLQELKNKNNTYTTQIIDLKHKQHTFQQENQDLFNTLFKEKQEQDKKWFIEHFDYIWKYKDTFKEKEPFRSIVIDFLTLYKTGGLMAGVAFNGESNKVYLDSLIMLWEDGMMFNGCPIIGIQKYIHNGIILKITYIKDNQEITETYGTNCEKSLGINMTENVEQWIKWINHHNISKYQLNYWDDYKTIDLLKKEED